MKAILFDLDGTVANTEVLKAKALSLSIGSMGGSASADIYKDVMGKSWEVVTDDFFKHGNVKADLETLNKFFKTHYIELIDKELKEENGISDFLKTLKEKNISVALVSSASPWMIDTVLKKLGLTNEFPIIVSSEDTKNHKPHPEAYLIALKKLTVSASQAIAFEDSTSGFQAAHAAGLEVYGLKHAFNQNHDFSLCKKTITSFQEFLI